MLLRTLALFLIFFFFNFCFVLFEIACESGHLSLDRSHSKCLRATCTSSYHLDHSELTSKAQLCKSQAILFPKKLLVMSGGSFVVSEGRDQRRAKPPSGHPASCSQRQRKIRPNLLQWPQDPGSKRALWAGLSGRCRCRHSRWSSGPASGRQASRRQCQTFLVLCDMARTTP